MPKKLNYPEVKNVGDDPGQRPGIVHRLDKETSGVVVVARNQETFDYLKSQFQQHKVQKTYLALVIGKVKDKTGRIDLPMGIKSGTTKRSVSAKKMKMVKEAITDYRALKYLKIGDRDFTLLEVMPKTGRTHQLRVHAASIGHPIIGDPLYSRKARRSAAAGDGVSASSSETEPSAGAIALFARSLTFRHPLTGEPVTFSAPYPPHFAILARRLGYDLGSS